MKQPISIIIAVVLLLSFAIAEMPEYTGTPMVELNGNIPCFTEDELANCRDVYYYGLDGLGRVGFAIAYIGKNTGNNTRDYTYTIEPTGWNNKQYAFIPNRYLYNRSHLIAHRFAGGGEVQKNLFTGTQYLNQNLMVQVESDVADYIEQTGNHVLYRITPYFRGDELVCRGVEIEAQSIENLSWMLHVFLFNIQPGVAINYLTGESRVAEHETEISTRTGTEPEPTQTPSPVRLYVLNTNTKRFHLPSCHAVYEMKPKNYQEKTATREELIREGYRPCGECNP